MVTVRGLLSLCFLTVCAGYTCNQFKNKKMGNYYINAGAEDSMGPCLYMPCTMGFWEYTHL